MKLELEDDEIPRASDIKKAQTLEQTTRAQELRLILISQIQSPGIFPKVVHVPDWVTQDHVDALSDSFERRGWRLRHQEADNYKADHIVTINFL